jgi:CheY-like chemotaxis protein/HPt (histidine-containing phosphotransfer) domain-containing protein
MITRKSLQDDLDPKKTLHILLAEDNAVNQKLAIRLLEKRGHRVAVAGNGRQALAALEKTAFDLVLMDVQMPEMDGIEATTLLREREQETGKHQPVVAMTALVMKGDRERCMAAGMDGYLSKPIRPQELDEVLDSYVTRERVDFTAEDPGSAEAEPPEPAVCATELLERIDGDRAFLSELLSLFRDDYPGQLRSVRQAVDAGNAEALQRAGHALKGALANLAAPTSSRLAGQLESMGRAGDLPSAAGVLADLETELERVVEELESLCVETVN